MGKWYTREECIDNYKKKEKAMSVNKVILIGNLGQDVELKTLPTGATVANFSIATTEKWSDKKTNEKKEETTWHNIVVWGKTAEMCAQYLSKGKQVFVEGKIQVRSWEDQEGKKRYTTEVKADRVQFLSSNSDVNKASSYANENIGNAQVETNVNYASSDIPF